jgi:hypothetical protein
MYSRNTLSYATTAIGLTWSPTPRISGKALMTHSGLSRDELIAGLSQQLPELINQLTPNGRLPTEHEVSRLI